MVHVNRRDAHGRAPLHVAALCEKLGIIVLLLRRKHIDIDLTMK